MPLPVETDLLSSLALNGLSLKLIESHYETITAGRSGA